MGLDGKEGSRERKGGRASAERKPSPATMEALPEWLPAGCPESCRCSAFFCGLAFAGLNIDKIIENTILPLTFKGYICSIYRRTYSIIKNNRIMKGIKLTSLLLSGMLVLGTGCGNMNNTTKGGLIGAGGGATLGAIIGGIAGKGKGAAIGAAIGTAVGTGAGVIIGKKMDKAADAARQVEGAQVEQITDANGLQAVKVTFDSGILFNTSSSSLSTSAQNSLSKFANNVLKQNNTMDIAIMGYTDNQPWRNSTAEQSVQKNQQLSLQRAQSVSNYLKNCGVSSAQIKSVEGLGESNPVADNSTAAGQAQNRRVEVYMYASEQMIREAEAAGR